MKIKVASVALLLVLALTGCASLTQPDTNYARVGLSHDRFDGMYYNYVEVGKDIPVTDNHHFLVDLGYENGGGDEVINSSRQNWYGDIIYEYRF